MGSKASMSGHMAPTLDAAPLKSTNRPENAATVAHGGQNRRQASRLVFIPHGNGPHALCQLDNT